MSTTLRSGPAPSPPTIRSLNDLGDDELLALVRSGQLEAYAEIYRRYVHDARRMARSLVHPHDVDDVVSESFTKMLQALQHDKGPMTQPVRYLIVSVRSAAYTLHQKRGSQHRMTERLKGESRARPTGIRLEDDALLHAFESLPPRWRQVMWWCEIDRLSPGEIGSRLGLSPNAASAMCYRARGALRRAYVDALAECA